jgi:formylglycine-generating enzyme required for sulfatase activity
MRYQLRVIILALIVLSCGAPAMADTFGSGANEFTLDFVTISGATNPASGIPAGSGFTFTGVNKDYRMGTYEITNDQWNKFTASAGVPTGSQGGYSSGFYNWGTGTTNVPTNDVSWYEAAQFVNWLNTSTGNQAAYKFTGTQGTSNYTFAVWSPADAGYNAANPYRNTAAKYFLPTENEWVKAAYWNGTALQTYATKSGESLTQGQGVGTGWNYFSNGPWNVGSGSQELNGTYDMMGNAWEWMENPYNDPSFSASSSRGVRGGHWGNYDYYLPSSHRDNNFPTYALSYLGFRVASVPEPGSIAMLLTSAITGLLWWKRRK